jgi:transposase
MQKSSTMQTNAKNIFEGQLTIGLDLGDRSSAYCVLNEAGEIVLEHKVDTTPEAIKQVFGSMPRCRMAMETGTHSPWVSRLLTALGYEVIVGHAQKVRLITKSRRKDDRLDARTLARLARIDPELLSPVKHRSAQAQLHLTEIRARAVLVSARTALVNAARGLVKSYGERLPKCGTQQFCWETTQGLNTGLREALEPLLREIESLNERIKEYDQRIEKMAKQTYPETALLKQVKGVGDIIATAYVLTIEDPHRSAKVATRDVSSDCSPGGGTRAKANHRCASAKRGTSIYGRCWCREHTTFWDLLEKTVICGAGGRSSRRGEGKPPKNGRWWRWRASWRCCCIGCG